MLNDIQRKKVAVIAQYCTYSFSEGEWAQLAFITGEDNRIYSHPRLLRSFSFNDDDYPANVVEVVGAICTDNPVLIDLIIDHFDIDLWYKAKEPKKAERVFGIEPVINAGFWSEVNLRVFFSHLAANRERVGRLAKCLQSWGVATFVAHDDIEPSLEWMKEIEKALLTMDVQVAVLEEGFRESNWCDQEIGYAMGRRVEIIPLRNGIDPYGFLGKFQGLQIKGKYPEEISLEIVRLLLKKPNVSSKLLSSLPNALTRVNSGTKTDRLKKIFDWNTISTDQFRSLLENTGLTDNEKSELATEIKSVNAFTYKSHEITEIDSPF